MSKIPCDVIKDLLPLYKDEVCSQKSKDMVDEHLPECEECRNYLEAMYQELPLITSSWKDNTRTNESSGDINSDIDIETAFLEKISKQVHWWKVIFCSFILLIAIMTLVILKDALLFSVNSLQKALGIDSGVPIEDVQIADLYQLKDGSLYFTVESDTPFQIPPYTVASPDHLPDTKTYDNGETILSLEKTSFLEKHILSRYSSNKFAFVIPLQEEYRYEEDSITRISIHKSASLYLEGKRAERLTVWQEGQDIESAPADIEKKVLDEQRVLDLEESAPDQGYLTVNDTQINEDYLLIIY